MYAIIDVGSNTVRLNIYKLENGRLNFVVSRKETVGLASYVKNGAMMPAGIHRVAAVLTECRYPADINGVRPVGTFERVPGGKS